MAEKASQEKKRSKLKSSGVAKVAKVRVVVGEAAPARRASGGSVLRLTPELLTDMLDRRPQVSHPALLASFNLFAFNARSDPRRPIPGEKINVDDDGNVTITHGYTDPLTGQFVEEEIDIYGPLQGGFLGPLQRHVVKRRDGTSTTEDYDYDGQGRLREIEVSDGDGNVILVQRYKYDGEGRLSRIEETDADDKTLRVTVFYYYSDGSVGVTITDYSTSPATVIQYTIYPPGPPIPGPI